ncbi:MAG TPA: DUF4180 domain-containing protein [Moheibacter sp.]|nr:DUF4180 domain-containing protein [Moheibacter sp.]
MQIKSHETGNLKIAEIISDEVLIHTAQDGLDLLGNVYYDGFDKMVLHKKNLNPDFFDLKTGLAGEILQKFSNYRMSLVIIGDFSEFNSKSLKDFIFECNQGEFINFLDSMEEAIK